MARVVKIDDARRKPRRGLRAPTRAELAHQALVELAEVIGELLAERTFAEQQEAAKRAVSRRKPPVDP